MAIHVRCSKLNFSKLCYFRAIAASKQTDSTNSDKISKNALIVQGDRKTALTKHCIRSLALTKSKQDEKRICPRNETKTSIYPVTNSVTSLIPFDDIFSLIGGFSSYHGNKLSDIEHLIGTKQIAKPVALSSDDIIIIEDGGSKKRFLNDLEVINEILQREKHISERKLSSDSNFKSKSRHVQQSQSKTLPGDQLTLCSTVNCESQEGDTNTNREPADDPRIKLLETKEVIEKTLMCEHFIRKKFFPWGSFTYDVVFENNFFRKNRTTRDLGRYGFNMLRLRAYAGLKYVHINFKILRITAHPEDQSIRVRWRLTGMGIIKTTSMQLQNYIGRNIKIDDIAEHHDCFSIFYVQNEGKIYKHVLDRVIPDESLKPAKAPSLARRIAMSFGLAAKS